MMKIKALMDNIYSQQFLISGSAISFIQGNAFSEYSKCVNVVLFPSYTMTVYIISILHITLYSLQCSFMTFNNKRIMD